MSIITDAIDKAGKEKGKVMNSEEYLNKIVGPIRKGAIKREAPQKNKSWTEEKPIIIEALGSRSQERPSPKSGALMAVGLLLVLAIAFLTAANIFFVRSSGLELAGKPVPAEAEAYSDAKTVLAGVEAELKLRRKMSMTEAEAIKDEFRSNFALSGIVYDGKEPWAVINDEVVKVGDTLGGAEVISIVPGKVTLLFKNERLDMALK